MSNVIKRNYVSLVLILVMCVVTFAGVFAASAQTTDQPAEGIVESMETTDGDAIVEGPADEDGVDEDDVIEGSPADEDDVDEDDVDEDDGFNLPPTFPADWTFEDIVAYHYDLLNNKDKKLFLTDDGAPKFIGVAANNGFSYGHEGLITEDEIQNAKAPLISAPKFTAKRVKRKKIKYAITEEKSCEKATYTSKIPKVGDLKEDGIYYICVKATKGKRTWEILSPLTVVRNTTVKGYAAVESGSVDCREVAKEKYLAERNVLDGPRDAYYMCERNKETIEHGVGTGILGIGGARYDLWKFTTTTAEHVREWKERETEDYLWPVH